MRWTVKSTRQLADALTAQGHPVSHRVVGELLHSMGYSLQSNRKMIEGAQHPDRNSQFNYLHDQIERNLKAGQLVVSVDTKKKELIGQFKNAGREWRPTGEPERVKVHDLEDEELGKAIPYGIYDIGKDAGWVNVGQDHDTATFAVASLRRLLAPGGPADLSQDEPPPHLGRQRRQQWVPPAALEVGAGPLGGRDRDRDRSATCRPGPANGTGSSTDSSPTSA